MAATAAVVAAPGPRRRKMVPGRRRVDDDDTVSVLDADDESMSEGSLDSDDHDPAEDSDTSHADEASPTSLNTKNHVGNGASRPPSQPGLDQAGDEPRPVPTNTEIMLNGLSKADRDSELLLKNDFDVIQDAANDAPVVVSSTGSRAQPPHERRRVEHDEYRRKRDQDPAFVPNRGAFFMHDHRHAGPSANGFRPFGRGGRGGRGRGGFYGGGLAPVSRHYHGPPDPMINGPWTHDMHDAVANTSPARQGRQVPHDRTSPNGDGVIPTAKPSLDPINRAMSTEKHLGNVIIRVFLSPMKEAKVLSGVPFKLYTKLPDHRPPLRRDRAVRISIPGHELDTMPRYIFPANDRSFDFIPRALRPNQQHRIKGRGARSQLGSISGFSRRTSMFGGSYHNGSNHSPSITLSRRSSIAPSVVGRDFMSPTGSVISRPKQLERPVVRLPTYGLIKPGPPGPAPMPVAMHGPLSPAGMPVAMAAPQQPAPMPAKSFVPPQIPPTAQKPTFVQSVVDNIPITQPRPQKTVSVENITPPAEKFDGPDLYQSAFHQQVPPQLASNLASSEPAHARRLSYASHRTTGTPLSQIPERAIHAPPFQPSVYPPRSAYYNQPYPMMPQTGYYYPLGYGPTTMASCAAAPAFFPADQEAQRTFAQPASGESAPAQAIGAASRPNLVSQEINGTMYFFDPAQLQSMPGLSGAYPSAQPYATPDMVGMPAPEGYYFQQPAAPGMVGAANCEQFNGYQQAMPGMVNYSQ